MSGITIDPEFAAMMPRLSAAERVGLERSILAEGCRDPLVLWEGILVDGHNRYEICQKHGIEYKTVEFQLETREEVERWIVKNQMARRNLSLFQRIEIVACFEEVYVARGKENMSVGGAEKGLVHVPKVNTREEMAKLAGVSGKTYSRAKLIIKHGTEDDKEALRNMEQTIREVYQRIEAQQKQPKEVPFVEQKIETGPMDFPYDKSLRELAELFRQSESVFEHIGKHIDEAPRYVSRTILFTLEEHLKALNEMRGWIREEREQ